MNLLIIELRKWWDLYSGRVWIWLWIVWFIFILVNLKLIYVEWNKDYELSVLKKCKIEREYI